MNMRRRVKLHITSRFWELDAGVVTVVELPKRTHEVAYIEFMIKFRSCFNNLAYQNGIESIGGASMYSMFWSLYNTYLLTQFHLACTNGTSFKQPDCAFAPLLLPKPSLNPCDPEVCVIC